LDKCLLWLAGVPSFVVQSLKLDRKDVEILRFLQRDGRAQLKDIARSVSLSIPAVKARIRRLKELGVIRGFSVIIDPNRIAEKVRAIVSCRASPEHLSRLRGELAELEEVRALYVTAGRYNLVLIVEFRNMESLASFIYGRLRDASEIEMLVISETDKEVGGGLVYPEDVVRLRCDFCHSLIVERPVIEVIDGGKYYFSSIECANAFKQRLGRG